MHKIAVYVLAIVIAFTSLPVVSLTIAIFGPLESGGYVYGTCIGSFVISTALAARMFVLKWKYFMVYFILCALASAIQFLLWLNMGSR